MISGESPISIGKNGIELQVIKYIQISLHMTIYGQNKGGFKRENNECIRNGKKYKAAWNQTFSFFDLAYMVL